jgi:hypothetical protein
MHIPLTMGRPKDKKITQNKFLCKDKGIKYEQQVERNTIE